MPGTTGFDSVRVCGGPGGGRWDLACKTDPNGGRPGCVLSSFPGAWRGLAPPARFSVQSLTTPQKSLCHLTHTTHSSQGHGVECLPQRHGPFPSHAARERGSPRVRSPPVVSGSPLSLEVGRGPCLDWMAAARGPCACWRGSTLHAVGICLLSPAMRQSNRQRPASHELGDPWLGLHVWREGATCLGSKGKGREQVMPGHTAPRRGPQPPVQQPKSGSPGGDPAALVWVLPGTWARKPDMQGSGPCTRRRDALPRQIPYVWGGRNRQDTDMETDPAVVTRFSELLGCPEATARFCLDACGGNFDAALSMYYGEQDHFRA